MAKKAKTDYKYGVKWLSKQLDLQPASIRLALRNLEIETNEDGVYGWNDSKKAESVKAQIKARGERAPAAAKKKPAKKAKKSAKKKSAKKPAAE